MVECTGEFWLELDLQHVQKAMRMEVQGCQIEKLEDEVRKQRWQGCLVTIRLVEWVWMGVFGGLIHRVEELSITHNCWTC